MPKHANCSLLHNLKCIVACYCSPLHVLLAYVGIKNNKHYKQVVMHAEGFAHAVQSKCFLVVPRQDGWSSREWRP